MERVQEVTVEDLERILEKENLFLTGAAGTGKSYLTSALVARYREQAKQVVPLGSTGVSAVNIGGMTLHSFFVLGICNDFDELAAHDRRNRKRLNDLRRILHATDLIVIDEVSMVGVQTLEMIRYRLEGLGYRGRLMFVGDFFQLPPIVRHEQQRTDLFSDVLYAFESGAWESFAPRVVELRKVWRSRDERFVRHLGKIRRGELDRELTEYLLGLCNQEEVYRMDPTCLFGRNLEAEGMNRESLAALEGDETLLFAELETHGRVHEKRLESWRKLLPVQEELRLKVGAPVLFTVNKWGQYVNGERGIVRAIEEEYILVEKEEGFVRVEPHTFDLAEPLLSPDDTISFDAVATLRQYPLKLAYAVTIHKSQGMSIDRLVCNVDRIFAPSQFYVALSRATDPRRLKIDFHRGDLERYLRQVVRVDDRVRRFYEMLGDRG
ncbi:ATP-dependent DNA helicase [Nitratifractor sp.]